MVESHETHKKDILKILLIIWAVISILIIFRLYSMINSTWEDVNKNYQYVPEGGQGFSCEKGQSYTCFDDDEYSMTYDPKTDSVAKCNALKNEQATCLGSTQQVSYCSSDQYSVCVDKDQSYATCGMGEIAICHAKGIYSIFSGSYSYDCNVGEIAYCQKQ